MNNRSMLISGASIAGPALASWLGAAGWDVTVVERFDHLRAEGQNVDIRGAGRQVLRKMGLEDAVRSAHTGETGMEFVDERGRLLASFAAAQGDTGKGTAELEILRGHLSKLLYDRSADKTEYRFGDQISALHEDETGVDVEFQHGPGRRFDAVVLAEGLRSRNRSLIIPDAHVHELGMYTAHLAIPRTGNDNDAMRVLFGGRGRAIFLRPDNVGTIRVGLFFLSDVRGLDRLSRADIIPILRKTYGDIGWETPRALGELDNGSMYFEDIGQAKLDTWSRGRIALLGDSAFCASPISGMGTTLSLTGAYVLAGELTRHDDPRTAFSRYEQTMRPLVGKAQTLPPGTPRITLPRSNLERTLLHGVLRAANTPLAGKFSGLAATFTGPRREVFTLPEYSLPSEHAIAA